MQPTRVVPTVIRFKIERVLRPFEFMKPPECPYSRKGFFTVKE